MKERLKKVGPCTWELPADTKRGMRVPVWLFLSDKLLKEVEEGAIEQAANVACLPGIYKHSIALPDMHFGYGFPIGGVAALDAESGGLSPGGIGFDINCGIRLLRTNLLKKDVEVRMKELLEEIFHNVPSGVGKSGKISLKASELQEVLEEGARWAVEHGYGREGDLEHLEEGGCMSSANVDKISSKALKRGAPQLGTLGAGNHFLEIQVVDKIHRPEVAKSFGINREDQVCIMIHTGSRGFGHEVCTDYLRILESKFRSELKELPDRELVYAPAGTRDCADYFAAMSCAANYAWCNRQMITHWIRESMLSVLGMEEEEMGLETVCDVTHNIGKLEKHRIDGETKEVYIHRKGGTRCFGPGNPDIPADYRDVGQPVLVPGDMGSASYVLVGTEMAEDATFSSVCHGAGRVLSRRKALKRFNGKGVERDLAARGILVRAASKNVLAEEAPPVYKEISDVVDTCEEAGISKTVARLRPLGVVKG
jgi:tRNA-splicing ligase RtcB